ncbi:hypothetical protein [Piscinibacter sp.]|jgi:hypothetical protein|uniref:hypothetical protein n=1 Tax=Piscinibacter sp. TaxID=1903157 RepID=UPI002F40A1AC
MRTRHPPSTRRALLAWWLATVAAALSATLLVLAPALAAAPAPAFAGAFEQFQRATAGDKAAIDAAATQFAALSANDRADPVLLAYSGAATTLRATTTMLPWRKMSFAEDGLAQVDKALTLLNASHDQPLYRGTPASLEVRFVAASTFLGLPSMLNRHERGARLLGDVLRSPLFAGAPLGFRGAVWLRAAGEAVNGKRPDEARQWLQQVVASGAPQAAKAQAQLKELNP